MRTLFLSLLFLGLSPFGWAHGIPVATNLHESYKAEGRTQQGQRKVMLVLVSQPGCSYCVQISEEILEPMIISGDYETSTIFREIEINAGKDVKDFSGESIDATLFARRYDAWATPTLLFLDAEGNEVSEKMIGVNTLELYGYYVDKSIRNALQAINP